MPISPPPRRSLAWQASANVAAGLVYFLASEIGLTLSALHGMVSPFWPASGVAVVVILLGGWRIVPGLFLGAFISNHFATLPALSSLAIAAGAVAEGGLAVVVLHLVERWRDLGAFRTMAGWTLGSLVAPVVAAAVGTYGLQLAGELTPEGADRAAAIWWLGDCLGILILGPILCDLAKLRPGDFRKVTPIRSFQALLLVFIAAVGCWSVFDRPGGASLLFVLFPILLLASMWFPGLGANLVCLGIAACTTYLFESAQASFRAGNGIAAHIELGAFLFALALTAQALRIFANIGRYMLPTLVLLFGWLAGGWIFWSLNRERLSYDDLRFNTLTSDAQDAIHDRMVAYVDALRGGVSLFAASDDVSRDEWRRYAQSLDLINRYPGVLGIGVAFPVKANEVDAFLARVKADGVADMSIRPVPLQGQVPVDPAGTKSYVVTYVEPAELQYAVGLDLATEPKRQSAARIARDYGIPRITPLIYLLQKDKRPPGFILFVPMYLPDTKHDTVYLRRQNFRGWIYAPFIMENFFSGVLGSLTGTLDLHVFAGDGTASERMVFSTTKGEPKPFEKISVIQLEGERFTCAWNRGPDFQYPSGDPLLNAITLALVPALLAGLTLSLQTSARRASDLAEERTRELRLAEQDAQLARKAAEAASAAKSDFLATMSHEIRTPLTGVIGYADLLVDSPLDADQRTWATTVRSSAHALLAIINDILDFSKIEAGRLELENIAFDPGARADEVTKIFRFLAAQKGVGLSVVLVNTLPPWVLGDPTRFRQVLLNLVSNGVKFTESGGVIIRMKWNATSAGEGHLRVEVEDTGIGIPEEKTHRLFQRFSQVDDSTTRRFGGTGLGLAICKQLVQLMGGEIGAESKEHVGTTIWIDLPFATAPPPAVESEAAHPPRGAAGKRVLLAEDVIINQKLATTLLRQLGCSVDTAANGREAVDKALAGSFDLIYMDCNMPDMDGLEATREIRLRERDHVPIIALTAEALETERQKCLASGMDDFITKPYAKADFVRTLQRWG